MVTAINTMSYSVNSNSGFLHSTFYLFGFGRAQSNTAHTNKKEAAKENEEAKYSYETTI